MSFFIPLAAAAGRVLAGAAARGAATAATRGAAIEAGEAAGIGGRTAGEVGRAANFVGEVNKYTSGGVNTQQQSTESKGVQPPGVSSLTDGGMAV